MRDPSCTIFISHVNEDPGTDTDRLLTQLVQGLPAALAETHGGYVLGWDRAIHVGTDWESTIGVWLQGCPAAIILLSEKAFDPKRRWLSHEVSILSSRKSADPENLCLIPVLLPGTENKVKRHPAFKPSKITKWQAIRCPDPLTAEGIINVMETIAETIRKDLPPLAPSPLNGLAGALAKVFGTLPPAALRDAGIELKLKGGQISPEQLTMALLAADNEDRYNAFRSLCQRTPDKAERITICCLLAATSVSDVAAQMFKVEGCKPPADASRRALILDIPHDDNLVIIDLYLTRAFNRIPFPWQVLQPLRVLETDGKSSLIAELEKMVDAEFGNPPNIARTALPHHHLRSRTRKINSNAAIAGFRSSGQPVFCDMEFPEHDDAVDLVDAVATVCPDLGVLFTSDLGLPEAERRPANRFRLIEPVLGQSGYKRVISAYMPLAKCCEN